MDGLFFALLGAVITLALVWARTRYAGFPAQRPEELEGTGPEFQLRDHLKGPILCEGVIYGPTGRVTSRFVGEFEARWDGKTEYLELQEPQEDFDARHAAMYTLLKGVQESMPFLPAVWK